MWQFYSGYSSPAFLEQLVQEILSLVAWGHLVEIAEKVKAPEERLCYLRATAEFGWTRSVLLNQVQANAYGRSLCEEKAHNFPVALPEHLAEQTKEATSSYYRINPASLS